MIRGWKKIYPVLRFQKSLNFKAPPLKKEEEEEQQNNKKETQKQKRTKKKGVKTDDNK